MTKTSTLWCFLPASSPNTQMHLQLSSRYGREAASFVGLRVAGMELRAEGCGMAAVIEVWALFPGLEVRE